MTIAPYKPTLTERVVDTTVRGLTGLLVKVDGKSLREVPPDGPLIIVTNHINFLEAPVIYTRLQPRPMTGFAKVETWDSRFLGWLFDVWGMIPVRRGEADMTAVKRGLKALKNGYFFAIAPEGTRSHDGKLGRGQPGTVMMALMSGAPLLPVMHYGHENYQQDWSKIRRPHLHIVVGRKFWLDAGSQKVNGKIRQRMTDEIMYQMAALLPPAYRGEYADLSKATTEYIRFDSPK